MASMVEQETPSPSSSVPASSSSSSPASSLFERVTKARKQGRDQAQPSPSKDERPMTVRELAETIAVAVILFLLLGIEAEGFVIPTGSMDPLLMGRH